MVQICHGLGIDRAGDLQHTEALDLVDALLELLHRRCGGGSVYAVVRAGLHQSQHDQLALDGADVVLGRSSCPRSAYPPDRRSPAAWAKAWAWSGRCRRATSWSWGRRCRPRPASPPMADVFVDIGLEGASPPRLVAESYLPVTFLDDQPAQACSGCCWRSVTSSLSEDLVPTVWNSWARRGVRTRGLGRGLHAALPGCWNSLSTLPE